MKKILITIFALCAIGFSLSLRSVCAGNYDQPVCPFGKSPIWVCPAQPSTFNPCHWSCL